MSASNLVLLGAQMSHFRVCADIFSTILEVYKHTPALSTHSVCTKHTTDSRIHPDHMETALTFRHVLGGGLKEQ